MTKGRFLIAATVAAGFWRCGRHFTQSGVLVDAAEFTEEQWERLKGEAMLRIEEASGDDEAGLDDRATRIADGIVTLSVEDFQRDGKPRLEALNTLLGDDLGKIAGAERDTVWVTVQENGFQAPQPTSGG